MKYIRKKHFIMLGLTSSVIAGIIFIIIYLSTSIQEKLEMSATTNIQGTVQLIADSVTSVRTNQVNGIYRMASTIHMDDDLESLMRKAREDGAFSWAAVAEASTEQGICYDGSVFEITDLNCEETALKGEYSVSDVHLNSQGTWAFTVQCPIYENNVLTGALYADISLEHFGELLPMSIYNGDGTLYILDKVTQRFIFQPLSTNMHISAKYDLAGFLAEFSDMDDELEQRIYKDIEQGSRQIVHIQFAGDSSYLFFWPVKQSDWYLCGIVPESSIQQESAAVGHTIIFIIVIFFVAVSLILWMLYWNYRNGVLVEHKQEQYRIALFKGISSTINEVVLMYDCAAGKREITFENIERILGMNEEKFEEFIESEEFKTRYADTDFKRIVLDRNYVGQESSVQKLEWYNPKTGQKQLIRLNTFYTNLVGVKKCILSIDDYTNEEALQDSLRTTALAADNANRIKSEFLSSMSHEIRTPLNAITGMLQIARKRIAAGIGISDCLDKADMASKQLMALINDVLDISKIESGKMVLEESWFRLDEILKMICITIGVRAEQKHQEFKTDYKVCEGFEVLGDQVRLGQLLTNLLSNAVKYTPEGGHISLNVQRETSQVKDICQFTFYIADNGIGMSAEFQNRMFLPFEREHDAAVKNESGTGLGLSIAHNIVSLMGGFLKLESRKGQGTTFGVTLAFRCHEAAEAAREVEETDVSDDQIDFTGMRVLLAEDNELNREIAVEFLEMSNAEVICAENGKKAYELFRSYPEDYFNLILMDMQMPVWSGLEATRQIRALPREDADSVLIIAATANAFLEDEKECLAAGMNDYITKPIDMNKLYQKIRRNREV